jgi:hypothetical protein
MHICCREMTAVVHKERSPPPVSKTYAYRRASLTPELDAKHEEVFSDLKTFMENPLKVSRRHSTNMGNQAAAAAAAPAPLPTRHSMPIESKSPSFGSKPFRTPPTPPSADMHAYISDDNLPTDPPPLRGSGKSRWV